MNLRDILHKITAKSPTKAPANKPDLYPCYECMFRNERIPGTIRIRQVDDDYGALYYCTNHHGAAHSFMRLHDLEWETTIQTAGFTRMEEPS